MAEYGMLRWTGKFDELDFSHFINKLRMAFWTVYLNNRRASVTATS